MRKNNSPKPLVKAKQVPSIALMVVLVLLAPRSVSSQTVASIDRRGEVISTLRPSTLASLIDELAGRTVRVRKARVVGVLNPRAFLIESATLLKATLGMRDRILVLVDERATLRVAPAAIVGSNVVVVGVARTLLGMQVTSEVPWPSELTAEVVKRLEVRGAVLARSVQTAEGVDLTDRSSPKVSGQ